MNLLCLLQAHVFRGISLLIQLVLQPLNLVKTDLLLVFNELLVLIKQLPEAFDLQTMLLLEVRLFILNYGFLLLKELDLDIHLVQLLLEVQRLVGFRNEVVFELRHLLVPALNRHQHAFSEVVPIRELRLQLVVLRLQIIDFLAHFGDLLALVGQGISHRGVLLNHDRILAVVCLEVGDLSLQFHNLVFVKGDIVLSALELLLQKLGLRKNLVDASRALERERFDLGLVLLLLLQVEVLHRFLGAQLSIELADFILQVLVRFLQQSNLDHLIHQLVRIAGGRLIRNLLGATEGISHRQKPALGLDFMRMDKRVLLVGLIDLVLEPVLEYLDLEVVFLIELRLLPQNLLQLRLLTLQLIKRLFHLVVLQIELHAEVLGARVLLRHRLHVLCLQQLPLQLLNLVSQTLRLQLVRLNQVLDLGLVLLNDSVIRLADVLRLNRQRMTGQQVSDPPLAQVFIITELLNLGLQLGVHDEVDLLGEHEVLSGRQRVGVLV